jgi:hypothetical protein
MSLLAITFPVTVPSGRGVTTGVDVEVGSGDPSGVEVSVTVGVDSTGVDDPSGVDVIVGVPPGSDVVVSVGVLLGSGVDVTVGSPVSDVEVTVGDESGTGVEVTVGVSPGSDVAVGDSKGVGVDVKVAVGALPIMVRLAVVEGSSSRTLSPFETRTIHPTEACPACKALALNVNVGPLVVALFPLLPAIATMKLPFCGSLIAAAASGPKSPPTAILLTCTKLTL